MSITAIRAAAHDSQAAQSRASSYFVDTDIGADDAVAIAWLLRSHAANIVGFSTVAGNTSVENATQNLLTLLDAAGRHDIPVTMGAAAPLVYRASHIGRLLHGPTGFWFSQAHHDLSTIPRDAPAAIAAAARANPGLILIALGPMTNLAQAFQRFPTDLAGVHIIALAGAQFGGNRTQVAEANAYFDPQALNIVLSSKLDVTLVTLDSFNQVTVDSAEFPEKLAAEGGAVGQLLASILQPFFASETQGAGGEAPIPDVAAVIFAARPAVGTPTSALVEVVTEQGGLRGQTIIATDPNMKVSMIADDDELSALVDRSFSEPGFNIFAAIGEILARRPDNARVLTTIDGNQIAHILERDLTS
jgi:inosine-uridine nucleoside N-ribohydrolase